MKKVINKPQDVVKEMLEGFVYLQPNIKLIPEHKILIRSDVDSIKQNQVTLISGGGSGHEPAHGGFIGDGCLTAVVCGEVFSSPTQEAVLVAIRECAGPKGVLLIVKNYTGDKINFRLAAELARVEGIKVEMVVIGDDVALIQDGEENNNECSVGARGIAGTVFVHKSAGALAKSGAELSEVKEIASYVTKNIKTMGVGLSSCTIPAVGKPSFHLDSDELEMGLGIHGEPGIKKQKLAPADALVDELLTKIMKNVEKNSDKFAVLINNLGSTTLMEIAVIARSVVEWFSQKNKTIIRLFQGPLMTSLEMAGFSLSVIPILSDDDSILKLLDAPTQAPAWPKVDYRPTPRSSIVHNIQKSGVEELQTDRQKPSNPISEEEYKIIEKLLNAVCDELISQESYLTELDSVVGDGDIGINLSSAAREAKKWIAEEVTQLKNRASLSQILSNLGFKLQHWLGGTSGPLYSIFFLRFAASIDNSSWIDAFEAGVSGIKELGDAKEGDRTMVDALEPAVRASKLKMESTTELLKEIAAAANKGAEDTSRLIAKRGRSTYLKERVIGHVDPGATAVAIILKSISNKC